MSRLTVDNDIPDLLTEVQRLARELYGDEEWTRDRSAIIRGALNYRREEYEEQLADREAVKA